MLKEQGNSITEEWKLYMYLNIMKSGVIVMLSNKT